MADCANLHFQVNVMYDNIGFTWSGFNDSMPAYITESIAKLQSMPQEDLRQIFEQVKEKLMIDWKNCYLI
jgi:secreted Zn-dependent insulinase-like peptidase